MQFYSAGATRFMLSEEASQSMVGFEFENASFEHEAAASRLEDSLREILLSENALLKSQLAKLGIAPAKKIDQLVSQVRVSQYQGRIQVVLPHAIFDGQGALSSLEYALNSSIPAKSSATAHPTRFDVQFYSAPLESVSLQPDRTFLQCLLQTLKPVLADGCRLIATLASRDFSLPSFGNNFVFLDLSDRHLSSLLNVNKRRWQSFLRSAVTQIQENSQNPGASIEHLEQKIVVSNIGRLSELALPRCASLKSLHMFTSRIPKSSGEILSYTLGSRAYLSFQGLGSARAQIQKALAETGWKESLT